MKVINREMAPQQPAERIEQVHEHNTYLPLRSAADACTGTESAPAQPAPP